jgi:hypothetical protein
VLPADCERAPHYKLLTKKKKTVFLLLYHMSHCVLCPMRPIRCCSPLHWGGCLHCLLGVPLPLAVAPRCMPCQPLLCAPVIRGAQLSAELHLQLSCIVPGRGRRHFCIASSFLTGPLTMGWATYCTSCWGAVPLGLARRGGLPSVPGPFAWATASNDIRADRSWAVAAVRSLT